MSVLEAVDLFYPEDDGKPLSENTIQFRLIATIVGGLKAMFRDRTDVFVAGDLLWYPRQGSRESQAPDTMVVFGRPKGDRRSYRQWVEGNIAPQVAFEIASPSNSVPELEETKLDFYERHGVEEYYVFDPERVTLKGWQRRGRRLVAIPQMSGWVSPRLGLRFEVESEDLSLYRPDGERLRDYPEVAAQLELERQRAELESQRADGEFQRAEQYRQQLDRESQQLELERQQSEQYRQQLELERQQLELERQQSEQYRQQLELERQRAESADLARDEAVVRLLALGMTVEQVAASFALSHEAVRAIAARFDDSN